MGTFTTKDGVEIFYKDWGSGQPVVFSHGWPLTADTWDRQLNLVASAGYRAIAHDRRGGGRSSRPWEGNDLSDRSQYYKDLSASFYGANRPGSTVSQGKRDEFWPQCMTVGIKSALDCTTAYVPTLIAHADDDQIVPSVAAARKSIDLVNGAQLKVYPGVPHGLHGAYEREFNGDLPAFLAS